MASTRPSPNLPSYCVWMCPPACIACSSPRPAPGGRARSPERRELELLPASRRPQAPATSPGDPMAPEVHLVSAPPAPRRRPHPRASCTPASAVPSLAASPSAAPATSRHSPPYRICGSSRISRYAARHGHGCPVGRCCLPDLATLWMGMGPRTQISSDPAGSRRPRRQELPCPSSASPGTPAASVHQEKSSSNSLAC